MSTLDVMRVIKCTRLPPPFLSGDNLGTSLMYYLNVFLHTDQYKESKEEKSQIELELQAAHKELAEEQQQHEQRRRELLETHPELICKCTI